MDLAFRQEHLAHHLAQLHDQTVGLSAVDIERLELIEECVPRCLYLVAQAFFANLAAAVAGYVLDEGVELLAVAVDLGNELDHPRMELLLVLGLKIFKIIVAGMHDLVNADLPFPQFIAQFAYILERKRQVVEDMGGIAFALFNPFRDRHFALFGQKRHRSHLLQIQADGVIGLSYADLDLLLFGLLFRGFIETRFIGLDAFFHLIISRLADLPVVPGIVHVDVHLAVAEKGDDAVELFRGNILVRDRITGLFVRYVVPLFGRCCRFFWISCLAPL